MTNEGNRGVVIISWNNVSNERIQSIISNLFIKNQDAISGMNYHEVGAESSDMVDGISAMFEENSKKDSESNQGHETSRKERSLEAFC